MANRSTTSVVIGWMDGGDTSGAFTESVARLSAYEVSQRRLAHVLRVQSGPLMSEGRNTLVESFLATDAEWLMMFDGDMSFPHDTVERLLDTADPEKAPMVGALAFGVNKALGQFPTLYRMVEGMPQVQLTYPRDEVMWVDATGAACVLQHRTLFTDYERGDVHRWYHRRYVPPAGQSPGGWLSEDLSWCIHLRDKGVPIFVDTSVKVGHVKETMVSEATYDHSA